eukprot:gnl/TRDRNA2_/TRDRNA2_182305_c0_seq1.p1 gnl/TRDRNA2_/TRDRNA2_182305_c0~~gnl/TRDRNA2_/TRDRNA2_182305_c0_seq1.p1  ORF type:complete len:525 (-),score=140.44 gnl/TRDRNA2_/TRDRNA2_182305_c0_seq1:45-1619(-)
MALWWVVALTASLCAYAVANAKSGCVTHGNIACSEFVAATAVPKSDTSLLQVARSSASDATVKMEADQLTNTAGSELGSVPSTRNDLVNEMVNEKTMAAWAAFEREEQQVRAELREEQFEKQASEKHQMELMQEKAAQKEWEKAVQKEQEEKERKASEEKEDRMLLDDFEMWRERKEKEARAEREGHQEGGWMTQQIEKWGEEDLHARTNLLARAYNDGKRDGAEEEAEKTSKVDESLGVARRWREEEVKPTEDNQFGEHLRPPGSVVEKAQVMVSFCVFVIFLIGVALALGNGLLDRISRWTAVAALLIPRRKSKKKIGRSPLDACHFDDSVPLDSKVAAASAAATSLLKDLDKEDSTFILEDSVQAVDDGILNNSSPDLPQCCRVRVSRTIDGYSSGPSMTMQDRLLVERRARTALESLVADFKGSYIPASSPVLAVAARDRHWGKPKDDGDLKGRGVFVADDGRFYAWVNEDNDHLRICSVRQDGDIEKCYRHLNEALREMSAKGLMLRRDAKGSDSVHIN